VWLLFTRNELLRILNIVTTYYGKHILGWVFFALVYWRQKTQQYTRRARQSFVPSLPLNMSLTKSFAPTAFVLVRSLCSVLEEMLCLDYIVQTFDSFRTLVWFAATSSTLWFRSYLWFLESFIIFSHVCHLQWNTCLWNLLRPGEYKQRKFFWKDSL
jgi:hypothetical protein